MSSVVISGDTSGTVSLQAPAVAGTTVLTLPATSGTVITTTSGTASSATTATTATNLAGGSNGTIPYQSASGTTQMLAVGTSGQVLQTNGAGAPSWVTPSAGAMTLISTVTANNTSSIISFTGISGYSSYQIILRNLLGNTFPTIFMQFGTGSAGSPTYITSGYISSFIYIYYGGAYAPFGNPSTSTGSRISIAGIQGGIGDTQTGASGILQLDGLSAYPKIYGQTAIGTPNGINAAEIDIFSASLNTSQTTTAIKLYTSNGNNFISGSVSLYGISS